MVLTRVKRTMLDRHHVLGKQHDADFTVVVCRNCHALFSAAQVDDGVPLTTQPTVLERHFAIYEALVSFLRELADLLCRWIAANQAMIAGLDREFPSWRAAPWAR
jgi:hypothetical protein